jgi:hypothetical protein
MGADDDRPGSATVVEDQAEELATELEATGLELADGALVPDHVYLVLRTGERRTVVELPENQEMAFGRDDDCDISCLRSLKGISIL